MLQRASITPLVENAGNQGCHPLRTELCGSIQGSWQPQDTVPLTVTCRTHDLCLTPYLQLPGLSGFILVFCDRVTVCPGTRYVHQAGLELIV